MSNYVCEVEVRRIYGNILYYPTNQTAINFTTLLNCKTFTKLQMLRIRDCGFEIVVQYKSGGEFTDVPENLGIDYDQNTL